MLGIDSRDWCEKIFTAVGLDVQAAPPVVWPGTDIGCVEGKLARLPAFCGTRLIAPACHDTASAIAGIPARGDDWAFISSGTWSLVGCVLDLPCMGDDAMRRNFSNEGGVGGKINFLKNVNGMWLLQQCIEQWRPHAPWTVERLLEECAVLPSPAFTFNVDDSSLMLPGNMPARINAILARSGHLSIEHEPAMASLILHSLAARYAKVVSDLANITGRRLQRIHVVGGGSRHALLNRLTEKATGLKVVAGSTESSTLGNFAVQLAALAGGSTRGIGVTATAVAEWASLLAAQTTVPAQLQPALSH
jgi:rhamnulokinase